jgi:hypothetical protein
MPWDIAKKTEGAVLKEFAFQLAYLVKNIYKIKCR